MKLEHISSIDSQEEIVDVLILCPCGHQRGVHTEFGCAGRARAGCSCMVERKNVLDAALNASRSAPLDSPEFYAP